MADPEIGWNEDVVLTGVLIYDGECPFCSAAATALRRVPDVGVISWCEPEARAFLVSLLGEAPFALFFVDESADLVYAGRNAATELCRRAGLPLLVSDLIGENYERIAEAVQATVGGREPEPYHDTFPLDVEDRAVIERLFDAAEPSRIIVDQ